MKVEDNYYNALKWAVLISLIAGAILFKPFFSVIIVALISAFLATPIYNRLLKRSKKPGFSATLTFLIALFVIIVPLVVVVAITINQAKVIITDIENVATNYEYQSAQELLSNLSNTLSNITGRTISITTADIVGYIEKYASTITSFVLNTLTSWVGSIGSIIANSILFIYIFVGVLVNKDKLVVLFEKLNPLGHEISDLYLERAGAMTKGMVGGQFTIAVIQGTFSAFTLYITGIPYFAFFALVLTFLSIIPLGAGIVTIPIGIARILMGDIWQGLVIVLGHILVVTNIDNVLKPILVPKSVRLHPALILLAVFGGMGLFGILGIVIGPVLIVLITSTINIYTETIPGKPVTPVISSKKLAKSKK